MVDVVLRDVATTRVSAEPSRALSSSTIRSRRSRSKRSSELTPEACTSCPTKAPSACAQCGSRRTCSRSSVSRRSWPRVYRRGRQAVVALCRGAQSSHVDRPAGRGSWHRRQNCACSTASPARSSGSCRRASSGTSAICGSRCLSSAAPPRERSTTDGSRHACGPASRWKPPRPSSQQSHVDAPNCFRPNTRSRPESTSSRSSTGSSAASGACSTRCSRRSACCCSSPARTSPTCCSRAAALASASCWCAWHWAPVAPASSASS